jgi:hypothetical protein
MIASYELGDSSMAEAEARAEATRFTAGGEAAAAVSDGN